MAKKKEHIAARDYEIAPPPEEPDYEGVAHHFIKTEYAEKPQPVVELSAEELELRDLRRRYKKRRGFKPTTKNIAELRRLVAAVELD